MKLYLLGEGKGKERDRGKTVEKGASKTERPELDKARERPW